MINTIIVNYNKNSYILRRSKPVNLFQDERGAVRNDWIDSWKDFLKCDIVFNDQNNFYFCSNIEDAVIVEG